MATLIEQILASHARGEFTERETAVRLIYCFNTKSIAVAFPSLPIGLQRMLIQTASDAPETDDEWSTSYFISSSNGPQQSVKQIEREAQERDDAYRSGIEIVRAYLESNS